MGLLYKVQSRKVQGRGWGPISYPSGARRGPLVLAAAVEATGRKLT